MSRDLITRKPGRCLVAAGLAILLVGCTSEQEKTASARTARPVVLSAPDHSHLNHRPHRVVTLAFAGDVHFQIQVAALLDNPRGLGAIERVLSDADVTMVNLESAITERGTWDPKALERREDRYWFRAPARALDVLADAGVDVVTVANNHGADLVATGLSDTLRAAREAPMAVIGVGRDRAHAFAPYRIRVHGADLAFLAADASPLESTSSTWTAGPHSPGLAAARERRPRVLLRAVRRTSRDADVVVVYLHWGRPMQTCPTARQQATARALAAAGADVIVGSHAHEQLGSGWMGDTYVNYGLGNFVWYHNRPPQTGVLQLQLEDGHVVSDRWTPAVIGPRGGAPLPLSGPARQHAIADWQWRRGCADLTSQPTSAGAATYQASIARITPSLRERMTSSRHAGCPVPWRDLRYLQVSHLGFDGRPHTGELVVAARHAHDVVGVFRKLYDVGWPIRRMRLVDSYRGNDDLSMSADNTSGFNCRRVKGSRKWSDHAFGSAIDINPVENPYITGSSIAPSGSRRFATLDRAEGADVPVGTISADDVVVRAFAAIGWEWGGAWAQPDYQHFASARPKAR